MENMHEILGVVEEMLNSLQCPPRTITQVLLCVEEVYVNVTWYAYEEGEGTCHLRYEVENLEEGGVVKVDMWDQGIPFNPLEKDDPDITLKAEERKIGGLGIFMTKTMMDEIGYEYVDGKNHLFMTKNWK